MTWINTPFRTQEFGRRELVNTVGVSRSCSYGFEDGNRHSIGVPKPRIVPSSTIVLPIIHFDEND